MKKLNYLVALLIAGGLFTTSCKKDSDPDPATSKTSFKASVDGKSWESSTTGATYRYGVFTLSGKSSTGATMVLRIEPPLGIDETAVPYYALSYGSSDNVGVFMDQGDTSAYATNQTVSTPFDESKVVFTKFDKTNKKVSGSFNIKVTRLLDNKTKVISGTFTDIAYSDELPPTPSKTMTAKVDGAAWSAATVMGVYSSMIKSVSIVGNASNGTTIGLNIPTSAKAGDVLSPSSFGTIRAQFNPTSSTYRFADEGKITITEHDPDAKVMKGTFFFTAVDSQDDTKKSEVTAGAFVVTY